MADRAADPEPEPAQIQAPEACNNEWERRSADSSTDPDSTDSGVTADRLPDLATSYQPMPSGRRGVNPRYLALLRIDLEALRRGRVHGDELCEIRGVGPVPVPVAQDLLGRAVLKLVITRGVDVVNVTHLGRGPTAAQKIALAWRNPTCTVEGCWRTRVENDHREPWAQTKHTRLDELDPLCEFHHDLKTRLRWALARGTGKRPLVSPDDPRHPINQQAPPPSNKDGPAPSGTRSTAPRRPSNGARRVDDPEDLGSLFDDVA
jgi:hypothetical protein